jgi:membrane protein implicated in regulation of membrane protease activity
MDPLLAAALTALGVFASAWITARVSSRKNRSDSGQQMIDQLQEDVKELRQNLAMTQRTVRVQGDYIGQLRRHIADSHPPPPPPWPDGLIT